MPGRSVTAFSLVMLREAAGSAWRRLTALWRCPGSRRPCDRSRETLRGDRDRRLGERRRWTPLGTAAGRPPDASGRTRGRSRPACPCHRRHRRRNLRGRCPGSNGIRDRRERLTRLLNDLFRVVDAGRAALAKNRQPAPFPSARLPILTRPRAHRSFLISSTDIGRYARLSSEVNSIAINWTYERARPSPTLCHRQGAHESRSRRPAPRSTPPAFARESDRSRASSRAFSTLRSPRAGCA